MRGSGELTSSSTFEALTPPAEYGGRQALVKAGGMEGYEQFCRVRGDRRRPVHGLGQRGHSWGNPDWDKIALTRTIGAWFDDATGIALATVRPAKADHHADEATGARRLDPEAPAPSTRSGSRPPPTRPAATSARDRAVDRLRRRLPLPRHRRGPVRARRSSSARCGSTSRSSTGTSRDAPGSAATTSSGARDQGRRQRLRRRRHAAAHRGVRARPPGDQHPARRAAQGDG